MVAALSHTEPIQIVNYKWCLCQWKSSFFNSLQERFFGGSLWDRKYTGHCRSGRRRSSCRRQPNRLDDNVSASTKYPICLFDIEKSE